MNFPGYRYDIVERSDHYKTTGKGNLTTQSWALGGNRFLQNLNQYVGLPAQHFVNLTCFNYFRFNSKIPKIRFIALDRLYTLLGKFEQGAGVWAQIGIVQKCIFFKTNIYESSIQAGN